MKKSNKIFLVQPATLEDFEARKSSLSAEAIVALSARGITRDPTTHLRMYGTTAVINVYGLLINHISMYESFLGYKSYEWIAEDIRTALADETVKNIVLDFDCPGGSAAEMFEMAAIIKKSAKQKPVYAWVGASACSAAYGLASACNKIFAQPAAMVGCVGVMLEVAVQEQADMSGYRYMQITATDSDLKNPDPRTDGGLASYKRQLDALNVQFMELLARNRGVSVDYVKSEFGRGEVFCAREAADRRMVDGIFTTFDDFLQSLEPQQKGKTMNPNAENDTAPIATADPATLSSSPASAEAIREAAVAEERARIRALADKCVAADAPASVLAAAIAENKSVDMLTTELLSARAAQENIIATQRQSMLSEESHETNVATMAALMK